MRTERTGISSTRARSRGATVVEFALILPVFCFLAVGTASLGRALYQYNTLTKAVRDGALYMARHCLLAGVCDPTDAAITDNVTTARNLVVYGKLTAGASGTELLSGLKTSDVTITASASGGQYYVTVTASYAIIDIFNRVMAIPGVGTVTKPGTVTATTTMVAL